MKGEKTDDLETRHFHTLRMITHIRAAVDN